MVTGLLPVSASGSLGGKYSLKDRTAFTAPPQAPSVPLMPSFDPQCHSYQVRINAMYDSATAMETPAITRIMPKTPNKFSSLRLHSNVLTWFPTGKFWRTAVKSDAARKALNCFTAVCRFLFVPAAHRCAAWSRRKAVPRSKIWPLRKILATCGWGRPRYFDASKICASDGRKLGLLPKEKANGCPNKLFRPTPAALSANAVCIFNRPSS